ncbi:MAG: hypothetical protein KatS3mg053_2183 [Candidatus Roseilinea sp.]|nr:MAG: hypothetical protein KatS3mg053_2183 [Candidatus Roseilinea sp.]
MAAGQRLEGSVGLYDYNARYYSPLLARFLSPDSIVPRPDDPSHGDSLRSQALNRYSYARNSPLVRVDPGGHFDIPSELHDFLAGANYALWSANALITDEATQRALLSYTEPIGESRDYNPAYQLGQLTGNVLAVAQGGRGGRRRCRAGRERGGGVWDGRVVCCRRTRAGRRGGAGRAWNTGSYERERAAC